jgi:hypothetical protein
MEDEVVPELDLQDPIKATIMPTDDAFAVFIEGVQDQPPVNTVSPG